MSYNNYRWGNFLLVFAFILITVFTGPTFDDSRIYDEVEYLDFDPDSGISFRLLIHNFIESNSTFIYQIRLSFNLNQSYTVTGITDKIYTSLNSPGSSADGGMVILELYNSSNEYVGFYNSIEYELDFDSQALTSKNSPSSKPFDYYHFGLSIIITEIKDNFENNFPIEFFLYQQSIEKNKKWGYQIIEDSLELDSNRIYLEIRIDRYISISVISLIVPFIVFSWLFLAINRDTEFETSKQTFAISFAALLVNINFNLNVEAVIYIVTGLMSLTLIFFRLFENDSGPYEDGNSKDYTADQHFDKIRKLFKFSLFPLFYAYFLYISNHPLVITLQSILVIGVTSLYTGSGIHLIFIIFLIFLGWGLSEINKKLFGSIIVGSNRIYDYVKKRRNFNNTDDVNICDDFNEKLKTKMLKRGKMQVDYSVEEDNAFLYYGF